MQKTCLNDPTGAGTMAGKVLFNRISSQGKRRL